MNLSTSCCLIIITLLFVFQPATQKSLTSPCKNAHSGRPIRRPERFHATSAEKRDGTDALIYPRDDPVQSNRFGVTLDLTPTPCPDGQDFCDSADDYPREHIKTMLKKQSKVILNHFYTEEEHGDVNRFGDPNEVPLCNSKTETKYPKKGKTTEGLFEFIVNDGDDHRQAIKLETCSDGGQCSIPGSLSIGYISRCVQKYIRRTLVVLDRNSTEGGGFITKPFDFPSCCSCVITQTGMIGDRSIFGHEDPISAVTPVSPVAPANTSSTTTAQKGSRPKLTKS